MSYRDAGVDIEAGKRLVAAIAPHAAATARPGATGALGGFGGLFDLAAAGYRDPVLVAATDGVGTKLKLAVETGRHGDVGIDLVAMCVNDLAVQAAEPLFFLDYYATGRLDPAVAETVIAGIAEGCRQAGCALIGGETAEMPGMYGDGDYDLAGFAVGAAERGRLLRGRCGAPGDILLGLASTGLHANGFSLVRRIVADAGLDLAVPAPFEPGASLGEALLRPTRIYVQSCLALAGAARGFAHITGGGLIENPPRVVRPELAVELDAGAWVLPPVFAWLAETGGIAPMELARVFNCGIGMVAILPPEAVDAAIRRLRECGETVWPIGRLRRRAAGGPAIHLSGTEHWPG